MSEKQESITVRIDGEVWEPANDETAKYDAIHAVAGAVLAGASEVEVIRGENDKPAMERLEECREELNYLIEQPNE